MLYIAFSSSPPGFLLSDRTSGIFCNWSRRQFHFHQGFLKVQRLLIYDIFFYFFISAIFCIIKMFSNFPYSCSDLYGENKDAEPVPHAMINLETWLPANYQVEGWQVKDLGPLGAGGR